MTEVFNGDKLSRRGRTLPRHEMPTRGRDAIAALELFKFIGTPLQLYLMLGNVDAVKEFNKWAENPDEKPDFGYLGNNIWEIYENFVNSKYETYFKKEDFKVKLLQTQAKKNFDDYHTKLAKSFIVEPKTLTYFGEFKDITLLPGIIKFDGIKNDFIHPTLKDYFAAKAFLKWIKKESNELLNLRKREYYLLKKILMKSDFTFIRELLNIKLEDITETLPKESLDSFKDSMSTLWKADPNNLIDADGKTILHVALVEENKWITNFLLMIIDDEVILRLMEVRDSRHRTVLYVAMKKITDIIEQLLDKVEHNEKSTEELQEKIILATVFTSKADREDNTILLLLDRLEKTLIYNTYKKLKLKAHVNYVGDDGCKMNSYELLKEFLHARSVTKINALLNATNNENIQYYMFKSVTKKGNNILHKTARAGNTFLLSFLLTVHKNYFDVNARCKKERTALHKAARAGSLDSVELLIENGAHTNVKDNWKNTPLRDAIRSGKLDVVQYFFTEDANEQLLHKDDKGRTALDDAAVLGCFDVVQWILRNVKCELSVLESAKNFAEIERARLNKKYKAHGGSSKTQDEIDRDKINQQIKADDEINPENIRKIIEALDHKIREQPTA